MRQVIITLVMARDKANSNNVNAILNSFSGFEHSIDNAPDYQYGKPTAFDIRDFNKRMDT